MKVRKYAALWVALAAGLTFTWSAIAASAPPKKKAPSADVSVHAIPVSKENRIVRYTYSPDVIFRIFTRPNLHTHIELGEDEGLKEKPVLGENLEWSASGGPRNLYIKPRHEGIETSMTVVTNKRVYQFQLIASTEDSAPLYQKVSFDYPDRDAEIKVAQEAVVARANAESDRLASQILAPSVDPSNLDFNFDVKGDAPFKPLSVYTDSKFTYLRLPNVQDLPVVFLVEGEGQLSLINYRVKDNQIIVERVAKSLLLKLGNAEVRIIARAPNTNFWR